MKGEVLEVAKVIDQSAERFQIATNALMNDEIDYFEVPPHDHHPLLARAANDDAGVGRHGDKEATSPHARCKYGLSSPAAAG
jgi:hypothetical protein